MAPHIGSLYANIALAVTIAIILAVRRSRAR